MGIERLSARDAFNLYWGDSDPGAVLLGWVATVERDALGVTTDADAVERLTAAIGAQVPRLPRLRQRAQRLAWGLGQPIWCDDPSFSLARHVDSSAVPAPGDDAALLTAAEAVFARPLPVDRPLWHVHLLTGLAGGRVAIVQRVHHALADGVAGAAIAAALLGGDAVATPPPWTATPQPGTLALLVDSVRWRLRAAGATLRRLGHPVVLARRVRHAWRQSVDLSRRGRAAPPTSLNRAVGPHRAVHAVAVPLADVKAAGRSVDATVNDVVLTAVAGGLRRLLAGRGEAPGRAVMSASVPVSVREGSGARLGNRTSGMVIDLRVAEPDDRRRLAAIAGSTRWHKQHREWVDLIGLMESPWIPAVVHRHAATMMRNQRMINVMVSNVPGPPAPMSVAGAPITAVVPILPIAVNVPIGVAAVSYAGTLVLGVRTDPEAVPDVGAFLLGLRESFAALDVPERPPLRPGNAVVAGGEAALTAS